MRPFICIGSIDRTYLSMRYNTSNSISTDLLVDLLVGKAHWAAFTSKSDGKLQREMACFKQVSVVAKLFKN